MFVVTCCVPSWLPLSSKIVEVDGAGRLVHNDAPAIPVFALSVAIVDDVVRVLLLDVFPTAAPVLGISK